MLSFTSFKRIAQRWFRHADDPASDNDLSYEDALIDWKVRRYMQAEYGHAEPPPGIFNKILIAIASRNSFVASMRSNIGALFSKLAALLYQGLARPTALSRLVPGVVAFGFVVAVLTTNSHNLIREPEYASLPHSIPSLITTPQTTMSTLLADQAARDQAIRRGSVPEGLNQFYPPANIDFYHPVERHLTPRQHVNSNSKEVDLEYLMIARGGGF